MLFLFDILRRLLHPFDGQINGIAICEIIPTTGRQHGCLDFTEHSQNLTRQSVIQFGMHIVRVYR